MATNQEKDVLDIVRDLIQDLLYSVMLDTSDQPASSLLTEKEEEKQALLLSCSSVGDSSVPIEEQDVDKNNKNTKRTQAGRKLAKQKLINAEKKKGCSGFVEDNTGSDSMIFLSRIPQEDIKEKTLEIMEEVRIFWSSLYHIITITKEYSMIRDPDSHQSEKLDPDPHKKVPNLQH